MSRTIRRKNYESTQNTSWDKQGSKTAGYYTECEYARWSIRPISFREPTKEEYWHKYRAIHADGRSWDWNLRSYLKRYSNKMVRRLNDAQLHKWVGNPDYEIQLKYPKHAFNRWFYD